MSGIAIRIIGGFIGVIISGRLYDHFTNKYNKIDCNNKIDYKKVEIKENKYFENILKEALETEINDKNDENDMNEIKISDINELNEINEEKIFINDALYDNSYYDCYILIGR